MAETKPAGMTDYEYNLSRVPPSDPYKLAVQEVEKSSAGDKDYERDQVTQFYSSEAGQKQMDAFYAKNSDWYNSDGSRTDYAGKLAPPISVQQAEAEKNFGALAPTGGSAQTDLEAALGGSTTPDKSTDVVAATAAGAFDPATGLALPEGTEFQFTPQQIAEGEMLTTEGKVIAEAALVSGDDLALQAAKAKELGAPDVSLLGDNLPQLEEIKGTVTDEAIIADVESQISDRFLQQEAVNKQMIADFEVYAGSTVKEQLAMLQDDWTGEGGENKVPFYAQGAVTAAKQTMAARGMGGSSMAAAAITTAGLNAMIPVAMADAQFFQTLSIKKFDMETSLGMAKLSHIANLDTMDLNFRQSKAVDTAMKFFQMDMSNVDNARLTAATNVANSVQALFTDKAAQNVAANLQYTTQAEQDRFYDQMALQAAEASSRMLLDVRQFNASVENSRTEFNATMRAEIERNNIDYLRGVNTQNTAGVNQQNMVNTQNLLNISNTAIANAMTMERDMLQRIFESSENAATRATNYAIAELTASSAMDRLTSSQKNDNLNNLGGFLSDVGMKLFDAYSGGGGGGSSSGGDSLSSAVLGGGEYS